MSKLVHNLLNRKFGWLLVKSRIIDPGRVRWLCICECGREHSALSHNLMSGYTRHCGCQTIRKTKSSIRKDRFSKYIGTKSGRLLAIEYRVLENGRQAVLCKCDCGTVRIISYSNFVSKKSKSCGCLAKETPKTGPRIHGMTSSSEYRVWQSIRSRCQNPRYQLFNNYGAKGIKFDSRWNSFKVFLSDVGYRPSENHVLDRVSKESDYGPQNCFWIHKNLASNHRSNTHLVNIGGETTTVSEAARRYNLCKQTINLRLQKGRDAEEAVSRKRLSSKGKFIFEGEHYTINSLAEKFGIPRQKIYCRIRRGYTVEQAVDLSVSLRGKFVFEGQKYSLNSISKKVGISVKLLAHRMRNGRSLEESINFIRKKRKERTFLYDGQERTLSEIATKYYHSLSTLRSRINNKWTIEEAVNPSLRKPTYVFNGQRITLDQFCINSEFSKNKVLWQLRKGKSLDEIFKILSDLRLEPRSPFFSHRGCRKKILKEQKRGIRAKLLELSESTFHADRLSALKMLLALNYSTVTNAAWRLRIPVDKLDLICKSSDLI